MALVATCLATSQPAFGDDAGKSGAIDGGGADAASEGVATSEDDGDASEDAGIPLACDGALCSTSNGATCGIAAGGIGVPAGQGTWLALLVPASIACLALRARRGTRRPGRGGVAC
jgi:hypothetical protein